jgi:hypothetical protein
MHMTRDSQQIIEKNHMFCLPKPDTPVWQTGTSSFTRKTGPSINLTNSSGVRLGVTIDVMVAIVVTAGTVFFITPLCVFWKHMSFFLLN